MKRLFVILSCVGIFAQAVQASTIEYLDRTAVSLVPVDGDDVIAGVAWPHQGYGKAKISKTGSGVESVRVTMTFKIDSTTTWTAVDTKQWTENEENIKTVEHTVSDGPRVWLASAAGYHTQQMIVTCTRESVVPPQTTEVSETIQFEVVVDSTAPEPLVYASPHVFEVTLDDDDPNIPNETEITYSVSDAWPSQLQVAQYNLYMEIMVCTSQDPSSAIYGWQGWKSTTWSGEGYYWCAGTVPWDGSTYGGGKVGVGQYYYYIMARDYAGNEGESLSGGSIPEEKHVHADPVFVQPDRRLASQHLALLRLAKTSAH